MSKLPPHSTLDEANLLGCVLAGPAHAEMFARLKLEHFYDERHRLIYETLLAVRRRGLEPDIVNLNDALRKNGTMEAAGGASYVLSLPDLSIGPSFFEDYLRIADEFATRRIAIDDSRSVARIAQDPSKSPAEIRLAAKRLVDIYAEEDRVATPVQFRSIGELELPPENDPSELLKHRYLCRRGALLIPGPAGMGKSSLLLQMLALFANGLDLFGLAPARQLTSLLVQAENDDGDLADMRNGICTGLKFTEMQRLYFFDRVMVHTSTGITGHAFCQSVLDPLLAQKKFDIVAIDPALSFLGGDVKEQKDVGNFLRQSLNPVLYKHDVGCILAHHTNKPKAASDDNAPKNGDWAYQGSGSAEWANWPRAVLSLQSTGTPGVYKIHAGKRGSRIGWTNDKEETVFEKVICHSRSKGQILWSEGDKSDLPSGGRSKSYNDDDIIRLLSDSGLATDEWRDLASKELGVPKTTFYRAKKDLEHADRVLFSKVDKRWKPVIKR